uniref:LIM/homeobox protein Lhx9 n=1 Tax=Oryzias sinensis TaxID=183150 RepID=A0A8C7WLT1_9TELE
SKTLQTRPVKTILKNIFTTLLASIGAPPPPECFTFHLCFHAQIKVFVFILVPHFKTGVLICPPCALQPMPCMTSERVALCAGCGRKIADRYYLLAVDKQWHMRCLKCCECKLNLESELTCFSKDGSIYCKEDYYRRFSVQRCARCHLGISASEMVMRARDLVYHLNCFTCTTCGKMLTTGDHFGMKDSLVYCRLHFETLIQGEYQTNFNHADIVPHKGLGPANTLGLSYFNGLGTVQKGRPRKRKSPGPGADCNENDGESMDRDSQYSSSQKTKRMRTSFKHHQLRTMKSYFAINHNPDAKDLKQLAQKTGLTKRVLQVRTISFNLSQVQRKTNVLKEKNEKNVFKMIIMDKI